MKIAHLITGSIFAGIEQHVYELAQSLNKKTSQIIICGSHIQEHLHKVDHETIELGSRYSPINILKLLQLKTAKYKLIYLFNKL